MRCDCSPFVAHNSQLTAHGSQLTAHRPQLTAHSPKLTVHNSQLTAHNSLISHAHNTHNLTLIISHAHTQITVRSSLKHRTQFLNVVCTYSAAVSVTPATALLIPSDTALLDSALLSALLLVCHARSLCPSCDKLIVIHNLQQCYDPCSGLHVLGHAPHSIKNRCGGLAMFTR